MLVFCVPVHTALHSLYSSLTDTESGLDMLTRPVILSPIDFILNSHSNDHGDP